MKKNKFVEKKVIFASKKKKMDNKIQESNYLTQSIYLDYINDKIVYIHLIVDKKKNNWEIDQLIEEIKTIFLSMYMLQLPLTMNSYTNCIQHVRWVMKDNGVDFKKESLYSLQYFVVEEQEKEMDYDLPYLDEEKPF